MESISQAIRCDDQPISGAALFHEGRYLTSWVTPDNLDVQSKYSQLTDSQTLKDKIRACWKYVSDPNQIRYRQLDTTKVSVDSRTFVQKDAWLDPAQVIQARVGNCFNKSILLASLLRQELPPDKVYVVLGNINDEGHAWVLARLDRDYIVETTSPHLSKCFIPADSIELYEPVIFFNDREVRYFPEKKVYEPLGNCFCIRWLEDYLEKEACEAYI